MKKIYESMITTNENKNKKNKNEKKKKSLKNKSFCNKVKIECLICSSKKNNIKLKKQIKENNYEYIDDFVNINSNLINSKNDFHDKNNSSISGDILIENLSFYNNDKYYNYNLKDIDEQLSFPNLNGSFCNLNLYNSEELGKKTNNLGIKNEKYEYYLSEETKDFNKFNE